jgi:hypothetical protein
MLPPVLSEIFREGVANHDASEGSREADDEPERSPGVSQGAQLLEPLQLEAQMRLCPNVNDFLGPYYRHLCSRGQLAEHLLPLDWSKTECELALIANRVKGFRDHWDQNGDRSICALYAALAEIEAFHVLIRRYHNVEALRARREGKTADALVWEGVLPHLYEIKPFWAYMRFTDLKQWPPGAFPFAKTRRLSREDAGRLDFTYGKNNSKVAREAVNRLLADASAQLRSYASAIGLPDCPKTALVERLPT